MNKVNKDLFDYILGADLRNTVLTNIANRNVEEREQLPLHIKLKIYQDYVEAINDNLKTDIEMVRRISI